MVLLPLGPKGKLPDVPVMSIVVGICTIAFSIYSFRSLDQAVTRSMKHEAYRTVHEQAEQFTSRWCETEKISTKGCSNLKKHLMGVELLSQKDFENRINSEADSLKDSTLKEPSLQNYKEKLGSFSAQLFSKITALPEWGEWREFVTDNYKKGNWLTSKSISFASVMKAQVTHGGWIHLISNMIFFFAFAGALEIRIGMLAWLAVYFVGGATGLILQTTSSLPEGVPLVGASAGISALAGAYLVFFWRYPTRVLLSMIVYNRVLLVPTFAFVLCLLVAQDVAGTLSSVGSVAYLAHLSSLVFGAVCAVIYKFIVQRDLAFLYPQEQQLFEEAEGSKEALALFDQILVWNPDNLIVRDLAFAEANKDETPSKARIAFYKYHLDELITQLRREKEYDQVVDLAQSISNLRECSEILKILTVGQCIFVIRTLVQLDSSAVAEAWTKHVLKVQPKAKLNPEFRNLALQFSKNNSQGAIGA